MPFVHQSKENLIYKSVDFDVIIIGSGISGGWAAKEFSERGYKTLLVERGESLQHGEDYTTENKKSWDMKFRGKVSPEEVNSIYPIQSQTYAFNDFTKQYFIKDSEAPYSLKANSDFLWFRGSKLGGKSLIWGRQTYRMSDLDFKKSPSEDDDIKWPIEYYDLKPWYDYVEEYIGVSGSTESIEHLPDGIFQPPFDLNHIEKVVQQNLSSTNSLFKLIPGRCAHLTKSTLLQNSLGREDCIQRNQCARGCSRGSYFSSNSSTLKSGLKTGNLEILSNTIVTSLTHNKLGTRITGVNTLNSRSLKTSRLKARVVFLCASTISSTQILLNSFSEHYKNGLGNSSGVLGHYLMDHITNIGADGLYGDSQQEINTNRPTGSYIPNFVNLDSREDFQGHYGFQCYVYKEGWNNLHAHQGIGDSLFKKLKSFTNWRFKIDALAEMKPLYSNYINLDFSKTDKWNIPQVSINCSYSQNEERLKSNILLNAKKILELAGLSDVKTYDLNSPPGRSVHEMGTARMGDDPAKSFLNKYNQSHDVKNLFITDGSCMTTSGHVNPSLTYMALTVRAVDYCSTLIKNGDL